MRSEAAVAAGHELTAEAACEILADGGNAADAAVAGLAASCVAEPVLASLGGGGFALAATATDSPRVYDFFCQTPGRRSPRTGELDFYPIDGDFGDAIQVFHIGRASVAVPGMVAGLFTLHRDLGSLPIGRVLEPAARLAREGIELNTFQHGVQTILDPIVRSTPAAQEFFTSTTGSFPAEVGATLRFEGMASVFEALAKEGPELFYRGELAHKTAELCSSGGLLESSDLASYAVEVREPIVWRHRGWRFAGNPAPSAGFSLIAFILELLEQAEADTLVDTDRATTAFLTAFEMANRMRAEAVEQGRDWKAELLEVELLEPWRRAFAEKLLVTRGTTHLSVVDGDGAMVSTTVSNGEGSGQIIPGTDIMLNNMLGEEDLNPGGFFRWPLSERLVSMMAPTLGYADDGRRLAIGSGGSNRIRTAMAQVLSRVAAGQKLAPAILALRFHLEGEHRLDHEPGLLAATLQQLDDAGFERNRHRGRSLFFGGVHAALRNPDGRTEGLGDPRRGGVFRTIEL